MEISTANYTLGIDDATGALRSLRSSQVPDHELIAPSDGSRPLFVIQYLDAERQFHQVSSNQAESCALERNESDGEARINVRYTNVADLGVDASVTVRCPQDDSLSYWSLALSQRSPLIIANVQFPFVLVPYRYEQTGPTNLLAPFGLGTLYKQPQPEQLEPDYPDVWQFTADVAHFTHYPGTTFAQFLAYYDEQQGIYVACQDAGGRVKMVKPVHHAEGLRLGISHVVGWHEPGEHDVGYEVAVGPFSGDWYDAADIYRRWQLASWEDNRKLHQRQDIPEWLLDSPLHVVMRIQGEVDSGPAELNPEFQPYEKALPALDNLSSAVDASLVPIIMSWEKPGPWVYPESFPVAGGDESLRAFTSETRARGWHVGTYCNGTCWVIGHKWTGYDGGEFFRSQGGEGTICRLPSGAPWREGWDSNWRPSFPCCAEVERTRDIASDFVEHLLDLGLDWIQFLDQNCGAATFPCYSDQHGHPSAPGEWMSDAMTNLLGRLEGLAERADREIVFSVESAPNDYFRKHFQICDIRPHAVNSYEVPLYKYLYHEYILTQAAFSHAPNPYWMQVKTANSFVTGDIPAAIMGPGGRLMAWEGHPWARWDTPAGDQQAILALLRRAIALRCGEGKDYLVYGRLLRPSPMEGTEDVNWMCNGQVVTYPSVVHACWQSQDGRTAVALANWTTEERTVTLSGESLRKPRCSHIQTDDLTSKRTVDVSRLTLALPPLSVGLVECEG